MTSSSPGWLPAQLRSLAILAVILAGSIYMSFVLWGENLRAQWGLIDDHEIMENLGPAGKIALAEVPKRWMSTEAGAPGRSLRYRPAFAALRLIEASLWGTNPHFWYLTRFVMFAISLAILWWLSYEALGLSLSTGFVLWALTAAYWPGLWACLGPGETYACFATAICGLGYCWIWRAGATGTTYVAAWVLVDMGVLIAAGSKENFIIYAFPLAWLLYREWRKGRLSFDLAMGGIFVVAYCVFIAGAVVVAVSSVGKDIYANPVSIGERGSVLFQGLTKAPGITLAFVAAFGIYQSARFMANTLRSEKAALALPALLNLVVSETILFAFYMIQVVFYNGGWTAESRYAFPGELIALFACIFVPMYFLLQSRLLPDEYLRRLVAYPGILLIVFSLLRGFDASTVAAQTNAKRTNDFANALNRLEQSAGKDGRLPIVLWSHILEDYEAIYSVKTFVRARGMSNPIVLQTPASYPKGGFTQQLADELFKDVVKLKAGDKGFAPAAVVDTAGSCVVLGFSQDPPPGKCISAGHINN